MSSYERFMEETEDAFKLLCSLEPVSTDEEENTEFLSHTAEIMEKCYEMSKKYYQLCKKNKFAVELPWDAAPFKRLWKKCRNAVRDFLCAYYFMFRRMRVYHDKSSDTYENCSPAALLYLTYLLCQLNMYHGSMFQEGGSYYGVAPQHIPYVRQKGVMLLRTPRAIGSLNMSSLMESIMQLDHRWLYLHHDLDLEKYIKLLELRLAQLLLEPQTDFVHDVECYRCFLQKVSMRTHEGEGDDYYEVSLYSCNADLLRQVTNVLLCAHRCLSVFYSIPLGSEEELNREILRDTLSDSQQARLHGILDAKLRHVAENAEKLDDADDIYPDVYKILCCKPSEVVSYVDLEHGKRVRKAVRLKADPTDILINQRERSDYNKVVDDSNMSLLEALDVAESTCPFACTLAVICLVNRLVFGRSAVNFMEKFVYLRSYIVNSFHPEYTNLEQIRNDPYPLLLQSFNYIYLYFRGKQYEMDDIYQAVILWFYITAVYLEHSVGGQDLEDVYRDIFGAKWRTEFGLEEEADSNEEARLMMSVGRTSGNTALEMEVPF